MLTVKNFSKSYNTHLVLKIDHLEFESGVHWIKGENGSGKSSFFRSIAGIIPCAGDVFFNDGINLHAHPVKFREQVSYSEAEPQFPGFLTAKDLIRFVGRIRRAGVASQNALIERFGISDFFENPCQTYSSGMLKKVSLLLAFLGETRLVILDEPLITLDQQARTNIFELIKTKRIQRDTIFFLSSHQDIHSMELDISKMYEIKNKSIAVL